MLLSLTVIALVAAAALAALNSATEEPIAAAQKAKVEQAISAVLPAFDRLEDKTALSVMWPSTLKATSSAPPWRLATTRVLAVTYR